MVGSCCAARPAALLGATRLGGGGCPGRPLAVPPRCAAGASARSSSSSSSRDCTGGQQQRGLGSGPAAPTQTTTQPCSSIYGAPNRQLAPGVPPPPRRRGSACAGHDKAAVTAAAPIAAAAAESWIKATGVPLLEVLQQMTLQQAAVRSLGLIAATVVGVVVGNKLLALVGAQLEAVNERMRRSSGLELLFATALASVHRPALVLLPWYGFFYILLVASAFADVVVARLDSSVHTMSHLAAAQLLDFFNHTSQLMQDTSELVLIIFSAWFLISWKDHVINTVLAKMQSSTGDEPNLARVLVPFSNLLSWAIVVASSMVTLNAFGVNVQPLLAVGSIGTVAVGFAAQSTMQNVVSALQIYSSRPFIVGDRIQLKSLGGSVIVAGVVENIAPMRTVVRGDNKLPVYINNKDVMNLIVVNESKLRRDSVLPKLPLITATLTLRYRDVDLLAHIEKDITEYLSSHPDVDQAITARCVLADFTTTGPQLALRALLRRQVAPRQAFVLSELLRGAEQIVRAHGGYLAIEELYSHDLPPSPPPAMAATVTRALTNGGGGGGGTAGSPPLPSSFSSSQSTDSV